MTHEADRHPADWDDQRERLSAYLDGELIAADRDTLERHLPGCARCQRELADLRRVRELLATLPSPALPRSFVLPEHGAVPEPMRFARGAPTRGPATVGRALQWGGSAVAAAGVVLLLGSALAGPHSFGAAGTSSSAHAPVAQSSQDQSKATSGGANDRKTSSPAAGSGTPALVATPPPTPSRGPDVSTAQTPGVAGSGSPSPTVPLPVPTPTPTPTSSHSLQPAGDRSTASSEEQTASRGTPPEPLTGIGLVLGGVVVVVAGRVVGRRAEPE